MKKILLLTFLYLIIQNTIGQSLSYWQQKVDYNIQVALNDVDHSLDGSVQIKYYNNSPDTLKFIWMHLWANAYKNDKTAFSDQLLENGRTDFYFSNEEAKGYINRLNFKVENLSAEIQDHPEHQDIVKLILPHPLAPHTQIIITTDFHEKLPYNFSRGGHINQSYQITQWYPKPAVYDKNGWHPIPYLDQGEFYSDFGDYRVEITVPLKYIVAATGDPENEILNATTKKITFAQANVHDFAWFADKDFIENQDTLQLSDRVIRLKVYHLEDGKNIWQNCMAYLKNSIRTKNNWVGEYPYDVVSVIDNAAPTPGGMEYPTITLLRTGGSPAALERVIYHEVGHNWFYGILATNERDFPWMDEGMNTYYDRRYAETFYDAKDGNMFVPKEKFLKARFPAYPEKLLLSTVTKQKKDQPINTTSGVFSKLNYGLVAYEKTSEWMKLLEIEMGKEVFDSAMQTYYTRWKFKHPYPEDFQNILEEISGKNLQSYFNLLQNKGTLNMLTKRSLKFASFFNFKETNKYNYIFIAPAVGYNYYDKIMVGVIVHNYTLPNNKLQFFAAPLYATGSQEINGLGRLSYSVFPGKNGQKLEIGIAGEKFTGDSYTDSENKKNYLGFNKIVPSVTYFFANKNHRSPITKYIQWKTFFINETSLSFTRDTVFQIDVVSYPVKHRYLNQLKFVIENNRVLYPYNASFQIEQGTGFTRSDFTAGYFFNYEKTGGLNVRLYAGKFFYTGDKTFIKQFETDIYHLNLSGPKGYEDYTYSNYFVGRNEFEKLSSQQIMIRDGAFKVRTDLLSNKIGKSDDWLTAVNFTSTIPKQINPLELLPFNIPVKLFADIGTYAEAWKKDAATGRFLYDAGLQVSLLKNIVNIYLPLFYSKVYSDYFKSTILEKRLVKNISFSIDVQNFSLKKLFPQISF